MESNDKNASRDELNELVRVLVSSKNKLDRQTASKSLYDFVHSNSNESLLLETHEKLIFTLEQVMFADASLKIRSLVSRIVGCIGSHPEVQDKYLEWLQGRLVSFPLSFNPLGTNNSSTSSKNIPPISLYTSLTHFIECIMERRRKLSERSGAVALISCSNLISSLFQKEIEHVLVLINSSLANEKEFLFNLANNNKYTLLSLPFIEDLLSNALEFITSISVNLSNNLLIFILYLQGNEVQKLHCIKLLVSLETKWPIQFSSLLPTRLTSEMELILGNTNQDVEYIQQLLLIMKLFVQILHVSPYPPINAFLQVLKGFVTQTVRLHSEMLLILLEVITELIKSSVTFSISHFEFLYEIIETNIFPQLLIEANNTPYVLESLKGILVLLVVQGSTTSNPSSDLSIGDINLVDVLLSSRGLFNLRFTSNNQVLKYTLAFYLELVSQVPQLKLYIIKLFLKEFASVSSSSRVSGQDDEEEGEGEEEEMIEEGKGNIHLLFASHVLLKILEMNHSTFVNEKLTMEESILYNEIQFIIEKCLWSHKLLKGKNVHLIGNVLDILLLTKEKSLYIIKEEEKEVKEEEIMRIEEISLVKLLYSILTNNVSIPASIISIVITKLHYMISFKQYLISLDEINELWMLLVHLSSHSTLYVRRMVLKVFKNFIQSEMFIKSSPIFKEKCIHLILNERLNDIDEGLCLDYFNLLSQIILLEPLLVLGKISNNGKSSRSKSLLNDEERGEGGEKRKNYQHVLLGNMQPAILKSFDYNRLLAYISSSSSSSTFIETIYDMFISSMPRIDVRNNYWLENQINSTYKPLYFWSMWETARYCVNNKLKSKYGGAAQTFQTIETMIVNCKSNHENFLLILQFIAALERHLYIAYEGAVVASSNPSPSSSSSSSSSVASPSPSSSLSNSFTNFKYPSVPSTTSAFFISNRKVCTEWLSRIRPHLVQSSFHYGIISSTLHHGYSRLYDIKRFIRNQSENEPYVLEKIREIENLLIILLQALGKNGNYENIRGLYFWYKSLLHSVSLKAVNSLSEHIYWIYLYGQFVLGKFEIFLEEMKKFTPKCKVSPRVLAFLQESMLLAYTSLSKLNEINSTEGEEEGGGLLNSNKYLAALSYFDDGSQTACKTLLEMEMNNLNSKEGEQVDIGGVSFISSRIIKKNEILLLNSLITRKYSKEEALEMIVSINKSLQSMLGILSNESSLFEDNLHGQDLLMQVHLNSLLLSSSSTSSSKMVDPSYPSYKLSSCSSLYLKYLMEVNRVHSTINPFSLGNLNLHLSIAKFARKSSNFKVSRRFLDLSKELLMKSCKLMNNKETNSYQNQVYYEMGMINYVEGNLKEAIKSMKSLITSSSPTSVPSIEVNFFGKACCKMTKWLFKHRKFIKEDYELGDEYFLPMETNLSFMDLLNKQLSIESLSSSSSSSSSASSSLWFKYSDWNFKEALLWSSDYLIHDASFSKLVYSFLISSGLIDLDNPLFNLTNNNLFDLPLLRPLVMLGRKYLASPIITREFNETFLSTMSKDLPWLKSSLINTSTKGGGGGEVFERSILSHFIKCRERMKEHYSNSIQGYLNYLKFNENDKQEEGASHRMTIITVLRLLRILVRYGQEFPVLFDSISSFSEAFSLITPQLFARLGHANVNVQEKVLDILNCIGKTSPHLIAFSTIVRTKVKFDNTLSSTSEVNVDEVTEVNEEDEEEEDEESNLLFQDDKLSNKASSLHNIEMLKNSLEMQYPEYIKESEAIISELNRISILYDEIWLDTLNKVLNDVVSKVKRLAQASSSLGNRNEIYSTIFQPLLLNIQRVKSSTNMDISSSSSSSSFNNNVASSSTMTPYERKFIQRYSKRLNHAYDKCLKENHWDSFKLIRNSIMNDLTPIVLLQDISPRLFQVKNSNISLPGMSTTCVESFNNEIIIIGTKTKPKRLTARGSNGKIYAFLIKGKEDLNLDERMMQLLGIINQLLKSSSSSSSSSPSSGSNVLKARHYQVVPIGQRSGIIEWVPEVTPLYRLYKEFQIRKIKSEQSNINVTPLPSSSTTSTSVNTAPLKPSELFFNKLMPLLNHNNNYKRENVSLDILRKVFKDLNRETPEWLLRQELWVSSSSTKEWLEKQANFTRSVSVMSMIGYIIGLGDRHLDNILINLKDGSILHIDYNVCFEKGRSLKVPELVPFRLTSMFESAFGLLGVEGTFRYSSESVLKCLREEKEILLTLLETFIYDPIVDWTLDKEDYKERLRMEVNVNLKLIIGKYMSESLERQVLESFKNLQENWENIENDGILLLEYYLRSSSSKCSKRMKEVIQHLIKNEKEEEQDEECFNQNEIFLDNLQRRNVSSLLHEALICEGELETIKEHPDKVLNIQFLLAKSQELQNILLSMVVFMEKSMYCHEMFQSVLDHLKESSRSLLGRYSDGRIYTKEEENEDFKIYPIILHLLKDKLSRRKQVLDGRRGKIKEKNKLKEGLENNVWLIHSSFLKHSLHVQSQVDELQKTIHLIQEFCKQISKLGGSNGNGGGVGGDKNKNKGMRSFTSLVKLSISAKELSSKINKVFNEGIFVFLHDSLNILNHESVKPDLASSLKLNKNQKNELMKNALEKFALVWSNYKEFSKELIQRGEDEEERGERGRSNLVKVLSSDLEDLLNRVKQGLEEGEEEGEEEGGNTTTNSKLGGDGQVKNSVALNILKVIKMKLEGRERGGGSGSSGGDEWGSNRLSIGEQVQYLISEATSVDNLAQMFEGWSAWI